MALYGGKDRCGLISALVLLNNGIDYETIMQDYLKTNKVNRYKAYKYYFIILLKKRDKEFAGKIRDFFLAKKEYLDAAFDNLVEIKASL